MSSTIKQRKYDRNISSERHAASLSVKINDYVSSVPNKYWEFPGWGTREHLHASSAELDSIHKAQQHKSVSDHKLGEWPATAICGNDILSSCLYVSGLVTSKAGKLAPLAMLFVVFLLYLYRFIYGEVVNAIPLNGGSYNVLLNTTTKRMASFAASLAILSYLATGVVSATSACTYLSTQVPTLPLVPGTIVLLGIFAMLCCIGIAESSVVALAMFGMHGCTLVGLSFACLWYTWVHPEVMWENLASPYPELNLAGTWISGDAFTALFFGFGSAMLGISGFESSSQFVEEQQPGVFTKTLKNMWWSVAIFNPVLSCLSLGVMPIYGPEGIIVHRNTVLAELGSVVGGPWLKAWISIDAFIVLSGAVLTAYVGMSGLVRRLAKDRVLPSVLLVQNQTRGTNHVIILSYFFLASSLVSVLQGNVEILSGVYTYAFLGLMTLFGCGCMLLKFKRAELPRVGVIAPWWMCLTGVTLVCVGFLANLLGDPMILTYFALYFISVMAIVWIMFERLLLLKLLMYALTQLCPSKSQSKSSEFNETRSESHQPLASNESQALTGAKGGRTIARIIQDINEPSILFFCKHPDLSTINKAILYVRMNEQTSCLRITHIYDPTTGVDPNFEPIVAMFDRIYPKLRIDFLMIEGHFGPAMIEWISTNLDIPKNMMFIKQTDSQFSYQLAKLGGVRIITAG